MTPKGLRIGAALSSLVLVTPAFHSAAPAHAATLRVGKSSLVGFTFVPRDVGFDKNIFAQNGLDIEVVQLSGGARLHQGMVAGAIDIGLGAGSDVAFLVKGPPEAVATVGQSFVDLKILDSQPDMSKCLTEQYLPGRN